MVVGLGHQNRAVPLIPPAPLFGNLLVGNSLKILSQHPVCGLCCLMPALYISLLVPFHWSWHILLMFSSSAFLCRPLFIKYHLTFFSPLLLPTPPPPSNTVHTLPASPLSERSSLGGNNLCKRFYSYLGTRITVGNQQHVVSIYFPSIYWG